MTLQSYRTEYEQANELFRHYQRLQLAVSPLFFLAFGILALTWVVAQLNLLLFLCLISVVLFLGWFNLNDRYGKRNNVISKKILDLEEILGLSLHSGIKAATGQDRLGTARAGTFYIPEGSLIILAILWIVRLFLAVAK